MAASTPWGDFVGKGQFGFGNRADGGKTASPAYLP